MWDLETSQRVEYPVEGRKCVSFTMRLSLTGMALRTAQTLEVDADALFSIQLVGMDPTKPVVVAGRVTKREQDKAWVEFSPEQSSVKQLHEWIRTKVVPEMEKALATGTMCVTRIHGLTDFVSDFLTIKGGGAAAPAASVAPAQPAKPDPRVAELAAELESARRESLELTEKLAAAEIAAAMVPQPLEDFAEVTDANHTDLIRRPSSASAQDNALTPANFKAIAQRHAKPIAATAAVCILLGAMMSFGIMHATATGPCTACAEGAADASSTVQAQAKAEDAPANANATAATTAPKPAAPAPSPAPTPPSAPPSAAAPVVAAPSAATHEAVPELAAPKPASPPASAPSKKPAPAHKSVARGAPRGGSKQPVKKSKAVAGDGSKDDAFLDSVFP